MVRMKYGKNWPWEDQHRVLPRGKGSGCADLLIVVVIRRHFQLRTASSAGNESRVLCLNDHESAAERAQNVQDA